MIITEPVWVTITAEDAREMRFGDTQNCPLVLAVQRALPLSKEIIAGSWSVIVDGIRYTLSTPFRYLDYVHLQANGGVFCTRILPN